jgi:hypothetical protein
MLFHGLERYVTRAARGNADSLSAAGLGRRRRGAPARRSASAASARRRHLAFRKIVT